MSIFKNKKCHHGLQFAVLPLRCSGGTWSRQEQPKRWQWQQQQEQQVAHMGES